MRILPITNYGIQNRQNSHNNPNVTVPAKGTVSFGSYGFIDYNSATYKRIYKEKLTEMRLALKDAMKEFNVYEILSKLRLSPKMDKNGLISIYSYNGTTGPTLTEGINVTYKDLGINENKLFEKIKEIRADADFRIAKVTNLGSLEKIGRNANFSGNKIIKSLGNLKSIGNNANFDNAELKNLGKLETIGGSLSMKYSGIESLNNLKKVGSNINLVGTHYLKNLGKIEKVNGYLNIDGSNIKDLGDYLKRVKGDLDVDHTYELESLGSLEYVGGDAVLHRSTVKDLGKLKKVGGTIWLEEYGRLHKEDFKNVIAGNIVEYF